jgi:triphosphoribosyl-dephospho-CoA synthase
MYDERRTAARRISAEAVRSLEREAEAAPKPGLVDRLGPGVHRDMDIRHFRRSAAALGPWFERMAESAWLAAPYGRAGLAAELRELGVAAEAAMLEATGGVNTHKGAIWTLGLLCAAAGSLGAAGSSATAEALCDEAAALARNIIGLAPVTADRPGAARPAEALSETRGLAARRAYGLRSARDEAAEGFPAVRARALPLARELRARGAPEDELVITVLLGAMSAADDTCLVARGGVGALARARSLAGRILDSGGPLSPLGRPLYAGVVAEFARERLSPGGSADLCAAALFLVDVEFAGAGASVLGASSAGQVGSALEHTDGQAEPTRPACLAPA